MLLSFERLQFISLNRVQIFLTYEKEISFLLYMYKYVLSMIEFALLNQTIVFGIFIQGYYNYYSRCPG